MPAGESPFESSEPTFGPAFMRHASIDLRLRREMTTACLALLLAYEAATGRTAYVTDYQRVGYLHALEMRDVTPDDIWTVVRYVRRLIRTGENRRKVGTFTPASLEMTNLLGDTARFMDRLQTAREELVAKRIVKNRLVAVERKISETDTITRLEPQTDNRAPQDTRSFVAAALRGIADSLTT